MTCSLDFVDSIAEEPTIRLSLADGPTWILNRQETDFSPPPLREAVAQTLLTDGGVVSASAYSFRTIRLGLYLGTATADATAAALQALYRELDRPGNILRWWEHTTHPIFFRTYRASASSVRRLGSADGRRKKIEVELRAEYAGYGLLETPVSGVTVSTDPAAGSNGCFVDVDFATPSNANPYFETDVTNWSGLNGATLSRSTVQAHEGTASMLITPNGSTADPQAQSDAIAVTAGRSYFGQAWLRSPGTPTVGVVIRWYSDVGGSSFISDSGTVAALTANTWTHSTVTAVAPPTAQSMRLVPKYSGTPLAATTLFVDEAVVGPSLGIKGDVESPAIVSWPVSTITNSHQFLTAVRRRGTPANTPFPLQAEAMTQGTNTTTQANDANFSGAGNNYSRCTFTTATLSTRLSTSTLGASGVDLRGRYRVFLRYRKNTSGDGINLQLKWGDTFASNFVTNGLVATPNTTNLTTADLGEISVPIGADPILDRDGTELPASNQILVELHAGRTSGSGTIDFDFLVFVPADDRVAVTQWRTDVGTTRVLDASDTSARAEDGSGNVVSGAAPYISGGYPMLSPGQTNRIYMIRNVAAGAIWALTTVSPVSVSYYPRYLTVRPAST
jgi:hypothetical protein